LTYSSTVKTRGTWCQQDFYHTSRHHIPEDSNLRCYCSENLKPNFFLILQFYIFLSHPKYNGSK
jgi:hypothetical protein